MDMKSYKGINNHAANRDDMETTSHELLITSISITVQRNNAHMILERQPIQTRLIESGIERGTQEVVRNPSELLPYTEYSTPLFYVY